MARKLKAPIVRRVLDPVYAPFPQVESFKMRARRALTIESRMLMNARAAVATTKNPAEWERAMVEKADLQARIRELEGELDELTDSLTASELRRGARKRKTIAEIEKAKADPAPKVKHGAAIRRKRYIVERISTFPGSNRKIWRVRDRQSGQCWEGPRTRTEASILRDQLVAEGKP